MLIVVGVHWFGYLSVDSGFEVDAGREGHSDMVIG